MKINKYTFFFAIDLYVIFFCNKVENRFFCIANLKWYKQNNKIETF